jgi:hypothetical protein
MSYQFIPSRIPRASVPWLCLWSSPISRSLSLSLCRSFIYLKMRGLVIFTVLALDTSAFAQQIQDIVSAS